MFQLRVDLQTETAGIFSIIKKQDTDWYDIDSPSWETARVEARRIINSYSSSRDVGNFMPRAYCQGGVLMKKDISCDKIISFHLICEK
jgi:hypothetical protein